MSGSYDLTIYDQAIWLYSRFEAPISTVRGMNILGDHFSPILVLLAPVYWIWSDVRFLLIFQATLACLSASFIYLILVKWLSDHLRAFFITITYFLFLGFQYALDYDFHLVSLSVFPLSLIFYGLFLNKNITYWVGIIIAFLLKEDLPVIIFFIGIYEILILKKTRLGFLTMFISACSFLLITQVLMPLFQENGTAVKNYIDFYGIGDSPLSILKNSIQKPWIVLSEMFNNPEKIRTFTLTLKSYALFPIFSPFFWIVSLPIWLERFLSSTSTRWQFEQYYGISLTPILVLASAQTFFILQKISNKFKLNKKFVISLFAFLFLSYSLLFSKIYHAPLIKLIYPEYYRFSETEKTLEEVVKIIPADAVVSAQQPIVSHLGHRKEIYWFPNKSQESQYIVLVKGRPSTPISDTDLSKTINQFLIDDNKETIFNKNDVYLFKNRD